MVWAKKMNGMELGRSKGIKKLYANRIASMLDPRRYDSLVSSLDNLEAAIAESKESLLEELQNAKIEYETSTKELYIPCTIRASPVVTHTHYI